jgi:outer membrane protein
MKYLILIMLVVIPLFLCAESEQIVYYNSALVLENNIELQEAEATLANEIQQWEQEIVDLEIEIEELTSEYEQRKLTLLPSGQEEAENQIEELKQQRDLKIEEIYGENGKIITRNNELIQPIMNKLKIVIESIAIENNYSIVLDASLGVIGYAKSKLDITDRIIEEMEETIDTEEEEK